MPGTVTVGCKLPNGLILQVFRMEDFQEAVMGGGWRTVKRAVWNGKRVKLNGTAQPFGRPMLADIRHGAALTHGVDADFFAAWLEQNRENEFVVNGLVFAHAKPVEAEAQARDHVTLRSGMEPIDPKNLPPEFRRKIETATARR